MSQVVTYARSTVPVSSVSAQGPAIAKPSDYPAEGTFVVYSIALDVLSERNRNSKVKAALARLKPKKYLGIISTTWRVGRGGNCTAIRPVATCPPMDCVGWEFPRRETIHFDQLYGSHYLKLAPCPALSSSDRPTVSSTSPLPWQNCVIWTTLGPFAEVVRYQKSENACALLVDDYKTLAQQSLQDRRRKQDFLNELPQTEVGEEDEDEGSEGEEQSWDDYENARNALVAEQVSQFGPLPIRDIVLELSEDLSELSHVTYPGDFEAECRQVLQLIDLAYHGLPYEKTLYDWLKLEGNDILPGVIEGDDRIEEVTDQDAQPGGEIRQRESSSPGAASVSSRLESAIPISSPDRPCEVPPTNPGVKEAGILPSSAAAMAHTEIRSIPKTSVSAKKVAAVAGLEEVDHSPTVDGEQGDLAQEDAPAGVTEQDRPAQDGLPLGATKIGIVRSFN